MNSGCRHVFVRPIGVVDGAVVFAAEHHEIVRYRFCRRQNDGYVYFGTRSGFGRIRVGAAAVAAAMALRCAGVTHRFSAPNPRLTIPPNTTGVIFASQSIRP